MYAHCLCDLHSLSNSNFVTESLLAFAPTAPEETVSLNPANEALAKITLATNDAQEWIAKQMTRECMLVRLGIYMYIDIYVDIDCLSSHT